MNHFPITMIATIASALTRRTLAKAALSALTLGLAGAAQAFPWTSIGSGGTPDETALASDTVPGKINLSSPYALLLSSPASSSAVLRYNVTAVFDKPYTFVPSLEMRFLDSSATTRVVAVLKSYNTVTGTTATLATVDSNAYPTLASYQNQISCSPNNGSINDFGRFVYWVEVTLSRTATTGSASVAALRIDECVL